MPTSAVFKGALIVTVVFRVLLVSPILRDAWIHARVTHLRDTRTCHGTAPVLVARLCENTMWVNNVSNSCWGADGSNPFLGRGDGDAERQAACPWARAAADRAGPGRGLLTGTSVTVTSAIRKMWKSSPLGGMGGSVLCRALPPEAGPSLSDCGPPSPLSWLGELLGTHDRGVSAAGIPGVGLGGRGLRAEVSW